MDKFTQGLFVANGRVVHTLEKVTHWLSERDPRPRTVAVCASNQDEGFDGEAENLPNDEEAEANTRLFAASPDLLHELKRANDVISVLWAHMPSDIAKRAMIDLTNRRLADTTETRHTAIRKAIDG